MRALAIFLLLVSSAIAQTHSVLYDSLTAQEVRWFEVGPLDDEFKARSHYATIVSDTLTARTDRITALDDALVAEGRTGYAGTIADVETCTVVYDDSVPPVLQSVTLDDGTTETTYDTFDADELKWVPFMANSARDSVSAWKCAVAGQAAHQARDQVKIDAILQAIVASGRTAYPGDPTKVNNLVPTYDSGGVPVSLLIEGD